MRRNRTGVANCWARSDAIDRVNLLCEINIRYNSMDSMDDVDFLNSLTILSHLQKLHSVYLDVSFDYM
jgi:hypothetical protein